MSTWEEARAAKDNRLRREARYYTTDLRGPRCPVCKGWTDPAVAAATGYATHPCCEREFVVLSRRDRSR